MFLFVWTGAGFGLFLLSKQLFKPDIIALPYAMHIFAYFLCLAVVFIGGIAKNMVSEILGNKKILFYYFIECGLKPFMLAYCSTALFEHTPSRTFK